MSKTKHSLILLIIFFVALSLRLYGVNWDQGNHLHPDERFLTMVETTIQLPISLSEYLSTSKSLLNPYNYKDYQFFVYGTFPLFLVRYVGELFHLTGYDQINLVGRALSALFDSFNIITLFFLSKLIFKKSSVQCLASSVLYAFCVLPLQLSHFFTVDTFLNFFILLTFTLLAYKKLPFAGLSFGLALACKISAIYFVPIVGLFVLYYFYKPKNIFYFLLFSFLTFRFFQPYSFTGFFKLNPQFIANIKTLESFSDPNGWFPPAIQWMSKTKIIFPLQNIILWGTGLPLTVLFIFSLFKSKKSILVVLSFFWTVILIVIQGMQFSHTMRYFLPVYPFICLVASQTFFNKKLLFLFFLHAIFGISFLSIYSHPHSRVEASNWIYQNIPSGSKITFEYWDDPLPLNLPQLSSSIYNEIQLPPYDPDSPQKMEILNNNVNRADYIIMSSNRLWGSIPKVPQKYPDTSKFYQTLFDESGNFKKVLELNSYPGFSLPFLNACYYFGPTDFPYLIKKNSWISIDNSCKYPGIYLRDDIAEEAFTVYDHPKVLIYKNE